MSNTIGSRALKRAIKKAGGQVALAEQLGVSQSTVSMWFKRAHLPDKYLLRIEAVTGVPRQKLRPDLYSAA